MDNDLTTAVNALKNGGLILYPTDTIWGIGCDATNEEAVARVYALKQRQDEKSLLILIDEPDKLMRYVADVPEMAWNLIELTEKPLTIIYPGAQNLAPNLIANDGSIGIRLAKDEFCRKMIHLFGKPVVSTSANISGTPWPPYYQKIEKSIVRAVDYVVKYKQDDHQRGKPSGIIRLGTKGEVQVIRE